MRLESRTDRPHQECSQREEQVGNRSSRLGELVGSQSSQPGEQGGTPKTQEEQEGTRPGCCSGTLGGTQRESSWEQSGGNPRGWRQGRMAAPGSGLGCTLGQREWRHWKSQFY